MNNNLIDYKTLLIISISFLTSFLINEDFSFNVIKFKRAFVKFFVGSPCNVIELIIGFSSTFIFKIPFEKLIDIFEKNLVSYKFLIIVLISSCV